jgi:hypothetical protein
MESLTIQAALLLRKSAQISKAKKTIVFILISCENSYSLPTTLTNNTISFGGAKRFHYVKNLIPPPGQYNLRAPASPKKGNGCTFGVNREAFSRVFCPHHPYPDPSIPGPGTYLANITNPYPKSIRSSSTNSRNSIFNINGDLPGPGQYQINSTFTGTGKQFYSKYKSTIAPFFKEDKTSRFTGSMLLTSQH